MLNALLSAKSFRQAAGWVRFPHDPLTDIDRTVLERGALRLATCEKSDRLSVDEAHVLQVQDLRLRCCRIEDSQELGDVLHADSPTHGEDHEGTSYRSLNPQHLRPQRTGLTWILGSAHLVATQ